MRALGIAKSIDEIDRQHLDELACLERCQSPAAQYPRTVLVHVQRRLLTQLYTALLTAAQYDAAADIGRS